VKSTTVQLVDGPLADVSIVELGARTGWLWRGGGVTLAGVGPFVDLSVERPSDGGETVERLRALTGFNELEGVPATGPVALGAFAFDRTTAGVVSVPEIVLAENGTHRWLTAIGPTVPDAVDRVTAILASDPTAAVRTRMQARPSRAASDWRDNVVGAARDRILAGELRKAVFARELVVSADVAIDQRSLIVDLIERFPAASCFAVDGFIGASPERLVSRSARVVRAQPLAGTAATNPDPIVDASQIEALRASTKDQVEHRITIDWLLSELLPFCSYVDAEPEPSVMTMENVHHLATTVEGMLSEPAASILDLVGAVHPTPALGGDPQHVALDLIEELEGMERGRYGGPVGWVDAAGNGDFVVGIRSTQIDDTVATVWAGVGVVGQSDPAAELVETQAKFRALLGSLLV
jgi:menaquinone-specific isochorismate synthase